MTLRRCLYMKLLKSIAIATFLVMILVLSGCAKSEPAPAAPAEPAPAVPAAPPAEEPAPEPVVETPAGDAPARDSPAGEGVTVVEESSQNKGEDLKWVKTDESAFSNVKCDIGADDMMAVTFTLKNENGPVALGEQDPLTGEAAGQVHVNGKRLKGNEVADSCGEAALHIAAGDTITCTTDSLLRRSPIDKTQKKQALEFSSLSYSTKLTFNCAE